MPLLNEEKRNLALRASDELQTLEQNIQDSADQVGSLLVVVRQQLEPDDFVQTASLNNIDPYQQTEIIETSWLDWLKEQFHFSKVNQQSLITPDDPYADTKQLISELERLEQLLRSGQWENIGSLNKLLYQLEQRGIETTLTQETIKDFSRIEKSWQSEALVWMEQL